MEDESPSAVEWISDRKTTSLTPLKIEPDNCVGSPLNPVECIEAPKKDDAKSQTHENTIDAFCPLCFSGQIINPVELHATQKQSNNRSCIACSECVAEWGRLLESTTRSLFLPCPLCGCRIANPSKDQTISTITGPPVLPIPFNNPSFSEATQGHSAAGLWNQCGVCEEEKCVFMCLQCGFALCSACKVATHTKGRFRQHEILPVEKARQRGPRKCSAHPDQPLDLFCQTCQEGVCITCCFKGNHRGHAVVPLPEIAAETKEAMGRHLVVLSTSAQDAEAAEEKTKLLQRMYDDRLGDVRGQVSSVFAELRESLKRREAFLLEQLDASSQEIQSMIEGHAKMAARIVTVLRTSHDGFQGLLDTLNHVSLMNSADRIQQSYVAVSSFLNQQICAIEGFATKLITQLGDPEARERLASFSLFPNSDVKTTTTNETSLREYKELLSCLGHLDFVSDTEFLWSASQTRVEDTNVDRLGLSLDNVNDLGLGSTMDATTGHTIAQSKTEKVCGKGAPIRSLEIGLPSPGTNREGGIQPSAIDSFKEFISTQEGPLRGKVIASDSEGSAFHFPSNYDDQKHSLDLKLLKFTDVVNAQSTSFYSRKRSLGISKAVHSEISELPQSSHLCPQRSGLSRLDEESTHQDFSRIRLESFFENNK